MSEKAPGSGPKTPPKEKRPKWEFLPPDGTENPLLDKDKLENMTTRVQGMREGLELRRKALEAAETDEENAPETEKSVDEQMEEHGVVNLKQRKYTAEDEKDWADTKANLKDSDERIQALSQRLKEQEFEEEAMPLLKKLAASKKNVEKQAAELEVEVRKAAMENLDYKISTAKLTRAVKQIGIEKGKVIDKKTPEQHKGFMRAIAEKYRTRPSWQKALFAGLLLSGVAVTKLHDFKDFQKPSITVAGEKPKSSGFDYDYYYPNSTPGAPAFIYTQSNISSVEHLFDSPIQVTDQDRLRGLWGILERKLTDAKILDASTTAQKKNYMIDFLEKKLQTLGSEGVKKIGFNSGDINVIHTGERLDLSILDTAGWVKHLRLFR